MCKDCQEKIDSVHRYYTENIPGLIDQQKIASSEYEYSEPMCVGGPAGIYLLKSPYHGLPNVQWHVESTSAGSVNAATIMISNMRPAWPIPAFASTDVATTEMTPINAFLIFNGQSQTIAIVSSWYDLTDSQGIVYFNIATAGSAYVNIQFRHKRTPVDGK